MTGDAPGLPRGLVPLLASCNFIIGVGAFMVIGFLEPLRTGLGLSEAKAGLLMTVYALSVGLSSPVLVALTGQAGRRRVLVAGLVVFGVASLLSAVAPSLELLLAARVVAAMGAGLVTPVVAAIVAALSPADRRARALAAAFSGITFAQVIGVPAGSFLAYTFGWRMAFAIVGVLALPSAWLVWTRVPVGVTLPPARLSDIGHMLRRGRVVLAVAFTAIFLASIYVVYTYLAPILSAAMDFGREGISAALVIFGVGAVLGNIVGGAMSDRIGTFKTLLVLCVAQAATLAVFSLLPFAPLLVMAHILVWSACGWAFTAPQQARLFALSPKDSSVLLALNAAAIYLGAALGSAIGGGVISAFGLTALGVAGCAVALASVAVLMLSRDDG